MQNNEFEKQVQGRMGQIKFTPSDAVWAEVEKNLKQKRKRRVAVLWFFLCFMIAGGASLGWLYLSPANTNTLRQQSSQQSGQSKNTIPTDVKIDDQQISSSPKKENISALDTKNSELQNSNSDATGKQPATTNIAGSKKNGSESSLVDSKQKNKNQSIAIVNKSRNKKGNAAPVKNSKKKSDLEIGVEAGVVAKSKKDITPSNSETLSKDESVTRNESLSQDFLSVSNDSTAKLTHAVIVDSINKTTQTIKIKPAAKPKWQLGISASVGMSDVANIAPTQKSYANALSSVSAPGNSSSFQYPPALYISPSELNSGLNFSLGAVASKKIKKRMTLNVGLQYHYYSTSIKVGPYLDSLSAFYNNSFYLAVGPRINNHQNKYHFIELPVTLDFQLLKNKPLLLNAGISLGQLLGSDELTYHDTQGVYYNDKQHLNKTQLNILLGLSWTFGEKSRMPFQLGPSFSYGASNLSDKSVNGSNHLYTVGVGAKVLIRKK